MIRCKEATLYFDEVWKPPRIQNTKLVYGSIVTVWPSGDLGVQAIYEMYRVKLYKPLWGCYTEGWIKCEDPYKREAS